MDLDKVTVRLRSREPYESVDLGVRLVREFWRPLYGAWAICLGPVFAIATVLALWTGTVWAPFLTIWLLKPAFDRIPLYVLSRGVFGEFPEIRQTLRRAAEGSSGTGVVLDCTIRRLAPFRGLILPLRELEQLPKSRLRSRKEAILRKNTRWPGLMMLLTGLTLEILVLVAGYFAVYLVAPPEFRTGSVFGLERVAAGASPGAGVIVGLMATYFVALSLVEVFYVAGSFGLYMNRRIHLEGWDIEIDFKRLARRLGSAVRQSIALVCAAVTGTMALALPGRAAATSGPTPMETQQDPQGVARRVLEDDRFGDTREEWVWRREKSQKDLLEDLDLSFGGIGSSVARIVEILLWLVVGIGAASLSYLVIRAAEFGSPGPSDATDEVRDPELRESDRSDEFVLPSELVETAVRHWERGDPISSLSILYRGTIQSLSSHYDIEIEPNMTARECVRAVHRAGGPAEYVERLARAWTSTAFADRPPGDDTARALFRDWRRHFTEEGE